MYNRSNDRHRVQTAPISSGNSKRLGSYLVEAGLLTTAQLDVALNDQKMTEQMNGTHMQLGEIVVARGWVKEQTIEYLMQKIIIPERRTLEKFKRPTGLDQEHRKADHPTTSIGSANQEVAPPSNELDGGSQGDFQSVGSKSSFARREIPISKPLPSLPSSDGDVSWVG